MKRSEIKAIAKVLEKVGRKDLIVALAGKKDDDDGPSIETLAFIDSLKDAMKACDKLKKAIEVAIPVIQKKEEKSINHRAIEKVGAELGNLEALLNHKMFK